MDTARRQTDERPPGLLQLLAHRGFALIAAATLVSNVGVWMRDTTSACYASLGVTTTMGVSA